MKISQVLIIGSGLSGNNLILDIAKSGFKVIVWGFERNSMPQMLSTIEKAFSRDVEKGVMTKDEKGSVMGRISAIEELDEFSSKADLVIDNMDESIQNKKEVYQVLDKLCMEHTIFISNVQTLSIKDLALLTNRPDRFIGINLFMNIIESKVIEVIGGFLTSKQTIATVKTLIERIGKIPILVPDSPGLVGNRIMIAMINEAASILMEGVAAQDIDTIFSCGFHYPMGPLALCDLIGLDVIIKIMEELYEKYQNPKYLPCSLLKEMLQAGYLGRKTYKGFYNYYLTEE